MPSSPQYTASSALGRPAYRFQLGWFRLSKALWLFSALQSSLFARLLRPKKAGGPSRTLAESV